MSGHSKWATIKHKKGAADAKRGKIFSKLAKEMTVVAKQGGGDPANNPTLRTLIAKGKSVNMPNDNIERAIKKGTGELASDVLEEITYEGYAAGGVGLVVKVLTDNKNRAAAEVRNVFRKNNSDFATLGAVSRNFERKGTILIPSGGVTEDQVMEIALGAGADDMATEEGGFTVTCQPSSYSAVCEALEKAGIAFDQENSRVGLIPVAQATVSDIAVARAVHKFIAALEDLDDIQDVFTNMDVSDAISEALDAE
jgi:YebC/PmpR family DNA-binding regulatory protein